MVSALYLKEGGGVDGDGVGSRMDAIGRDEGAADGGGGKEGGGESVLGETVVGDGHLPLPEALVALLDGAEEGDDEEGEAEDEGHQRDDNMVRRCRRQRGS